MTAISFSSILQYVALAPMTIYQCLQSCHVLHIMIYKYSLFSPAILISVRSSFKDTGEVI